MEFSELVVKRRSIRKFRADAVAKQLINKVLEAGRWAPSAGNSQPWRFIVITDAEIKGKIAENCTRFSREAWKHFPPERARYLAARGGTWDKSHLKDVPVLIAVCHEVLDNIQKELVLASVWTAVENMLLAAIDNGLGSCVYTFYNAEEENKLKKILMVPSNFGIACIIQLGYASRNPPSPSRKSLEEIVSYQHF
jgi:nitroreductase